MKKQTKTILLIALAIIAAGGGIFLGMNLNKPTDNQPVIQGLEDAEDYTGNRDTY